MRRLCPAPPRGGNLFTRCAGRGWRRGRRREDLLADRACDLSRIRVLRRHWLTDPVIQKKSPQRSLEREVKELAGF
ncbi:mCG1040639 [Mus musculus]|nr:mCG1040639 [Mus musculus]